MLKLNFTFYGRLSVLCSSDQHSHHMSTMHFWFQHEKLFYCSTYSSFISVILFLFFPIDSCFINFIIMIWFQHLPEWSTEIIFRFDVYYGAVPIYVAWFCFVSILWFCIIVPILIHHFPEWTNLDSLIF